MIYRRLRQEVASRKRYARILAAVEASDVHAAEQAMREYIDANFQYLREESHNEASRER